MNRLNIIIALLFSALLSPLFAQKVYTVKKGETLSSIAKAHQTTVGDIMRLNKMNSDSKLIIGEKIKIPKTSEKNSKANTKNQSHVIKKGETLSQLAAEYNTTVGDIMRLNDMYEDSKIIIGEKILIPPPGVTVVRKGAPKPAEPEDDFTVVEANTITTFETDTAATSVQELSQKKQEEHSIHDESFFAPLYQIGNAQEIVRTGLSRTFQSESGWEDKKYFILMNEVDPGKVVKIQYGNKTIYAKVLWNLGLGKENEGLAYRISNAAAEVLGITDSEFALSVSFIK